MGDLYCFLRTNGSDGSPLSLEALSRHSFYKTRSQMRTRLFALNGSGLTRFDHGLLTFTSWLIQAADDPRLLITRLSAWSESALPEASTSSTERATE